jgi:hypothetical protein
MKKLVVLLTFVVVMTGVGFYRGWFTVNPDKIEQDERRAKEEVRELVHEMKEKSAQRAGKSDPRSTPAPAPRGSAPR